jgi:peptidoglycan/xylan/chitin deacetylase (PgdA/CDA1 family)
MFRRSLVALFIPFAALAATPEKPTAEKAAATSDKPAAPAAEMAKPSEVQATSNSGPRITYNQCHVDGPYIALTFDDGPHGTNTPRLLDMLKQRNVKATFFCVGQCVAEYPDIAKRIVDEGHEIASHSWSHPNLIPMSEANVRDQLERTHQVIKQATGVEVKDFRPPYGNFTQRQRNWAHATYGYKIIMWDVDPLDWKVRSASHVENEIVRRTQQGSIILTHDIHKSTVDAMPSTIDALLAKGFKFVTVAELTAMDKPAPPKPKATPAVKAQSARPTAAN